MGSSIGPLEEDKFRRAPGHDTTSGSLDGALQGTDRPDESASAVGMVLPAHGENLASEQSSEGAPASLQPAGLLGASALQRTIHTQQRADLLLELQRTQGNAYTRRVARSLNSSVQRTPVQRDSKRSKDKESTEATLEMHVEAASQGEFSARGYSLSITVSQAGAKSQRDSNKQESKAQVVMPVGPSTVKLLKALAKGEVIKVVRFDMLKKDPDTGEETVYHSITLHNALVTGVQLSGGSKEGGSKHGQSYDAEELAIVSFAAQGMDSGSKEGAAQDEP